MTAESSSAKKYDSELSASLVAKARALATPDGAFSSPDMRAVDLAIRLVAPGPKACAVSASECHEITEAVIAAYGRDTFQIQAHGVLTALADQLEAAGEVVKEVSKEVSKWHGETHELRSRLERSDKALAEAGAPMNELLTDQGAEWVRCALALIALKLDAVQVDLVRTQHDRDFFREQATQCGRGLREALSEIDQLSMKLRHAQKKIVAASSCVPEVSKRAKTKLSKKLLSRTKIRKAVKIRKKQ